MWRRVVGTIAAVCVVGRVLLLNAAVRAAEPANPADADARETRSEFAPRQILVRYKEGHARDDLKRKTAERSRRAKTASGMIANRLEDIRARAGGDKPPEEELKDIARIEEELGVVESERVVDNLFLVKSRNQVPPGVLVSRFRSLSGVERAQPDYYYQILAAPNDPRYKSGELWGMHRIRAEEAWDRSIGSRSVLAAVVDAGIDPNHEDIAANMVEFKDFADCSVYYTGHGTHVAGTIGAIGNNGEGVVGVNWEVGILGMNIDCDGQDMLTSRIIKGTRHAVDAGARVVNYSFGGSRPNPELAAEIDYAVGRGVAVVVSAGNTPGPYADSLYPANDPDVITVSATGPNDELAHYSSYGRSVDVAAPGGDPPGGSSTCAASSSDCILSTWPGSSLRYKAIAGTSMAAPHVTGLVALMLSANEALSLSEVKRILYDTADDKGAAGWDQRFGHGRINANAALTAIAGEKPTPTPTQTQTPTPTPTAILTLTPSPTPNDCNPPGEPTNPAAEVSFCAESGATVPVAFGWDGASRARQYRVQVFDDVGLSNKVAEREVVETSARIGLAAGRWYWKVRAENDCGESEWVVYSYE